MKPKQHTYVDPDDYLGADENDRQDATVEARFADSCTNNVPVGWAAPASIATRRVGEVRVKLHHQCNNGGQTVLDASADWRDRYMDRAWVAGEVNAQDLPGGNSYAAAVAYAIAELDGYTGKGANGAAPPALIGAGTAGVGEYWTPWANFYIYADAAGQLCAWNNTGAAVYLWGDVGLTGDIGGF